MLKLVIFDFDGVIADSEPAHFEIFRQVLADEGLVLSWDLYCRKYLGYSDLECFVQVLRDMGRNSSPGEIHDLCQRKKERFAVYIRHHGIILPGVVQLLENLRAHQVVCSICSGALRSEVEMILEMAGLRNYFTIIVAAEDVQRGKPDPEGYQLALLRSNHESGCVPPVEPCQTVAIEDSLWGIEAAKGAGYKCLGVASTYPKEQLNSADWVVNTLEEVDCQKLQKLLIP